MKIFSVTRSEVIQSLAVFLSGILLIGVSLWMPARNKEKRFYFPPPDQIEHFTFGYRYPMADLLWIRTIQDFDYCEQEIAERQCRNNSWLYHMLNAILTLSPDFKIVALTGPVALGVLISDYDGATRLFDKVVELFPMDWKILYRAAHHSIENEKNSLKAAQLMERAGKNGAPDWVLSLSTKLYTEAGRKELGERLYQEMKDQGFSETILERMRKRLDGIKL